MRPTLADAQRYLARDGFDLVLADIRLPDGDGTTLLEHISNFKKPPLTVMITGHGTIESAVNCMRAGAFDYVVKPFSPSEIEMVVKKADAFDHIRRVNHHLSHESASGADLIGESPMMLQLKQLIRKVARTNATVLIHGENGTGKEMVASELLPPQLEIGRPVYQGELRGDLGKPHGERVFWPRKGGLHRRHRAARRTL